MFRPQAVHIPLFCRVVKNFRSIQFRNLDRDALRHNFGARRRSSADVYGRHQPLSARCRRQDAAVVTEQIDDEHLVDLGGIGFQYLSVINNSDPVARLESWNRNG